VSANWRYLHSPYWQYKWEYLVCKFSDIIYPKLISICPYYSLSFLVSTLVTVYHRLHTPFLLQSNVSACSLCLSIIAVCPWLATAAMSQFFSIYSSVCLFQNHNQNSVTSTSCTISLRSNIDSISRQFCSVTHIAPNKTVATCENSSGEWWNFISNFLTK
jgi:hypothetical protein